MLKIKINKKKFLIGSIIILTMAIGLFALFRDDQPKETVAKLPGKINFGPPTEQEKRETEEFKRNQQEEKPPIEDSPTKKQVTPDVSYAGQYDAVVEASAYVYAIFEDGGACTYTFTSNSKTITKTTTGVKDATTTRCPMVSVPASEFNPKGNWSLVVSYRSSTAEGSSGSVSFEVK